jgi:hypothetical protein
VTVDAQPRLNDFNPNRLVLLNTTGEYIVARMSILRLFISSFLVLPLVLGAGVGVCYANASTGIDEHAHHSVDGGPCDGECSYDHCFTHCAVNATEHLQQDALQPTTRIDDLDDNLVAVFKFSESIWPQAQVTSNSAREHVPPQRTVDSPVHRYDRLLNLPANFLMSVAYRRH